MEVMIMNSEEYNGWSNYETWLANLWLNNDQDCYSIICYVLTLATDIYAKANKLKDLVRERLDEVNLDPSLASDLLSSSFLRINWVEIIQNN